jgi:hypothetical protein
VLRALHGLQADGGFPDAAALQAERARLQVPGLVVVVSDFHQERDEIHEFVRRVSTTHNEVAALQLLCGDEERFPWDGPVRFEDLETGETVLVSGKAAREGYLEARRGYQARLQAALGLLDVRLDTLDIDAPLDQAMATFLERRRQRLGR